MSFSQPKFSYQGKKWHNHRRSLRLLQRRQRQRGGEIRTKNHNLYVCVRGTRKIIPVHVNLATESVKSAWVAARYEDDSIGMHFEVMYNGVFRPRHTALKTWGIKKNDILTLVPTSDPDLQKFLRTHPYYYSVRNTTFATSDAYEKWARDPHPTKPIE